MSYSKFGLARENRPRVSQNANRELTDKEKKAAEVGYIVNDKGVPVAPAPNRMGGGFKTQILVGSDNRDIP